MRYVYLHTCLAILQTITGCKAYHYLVLNGTGPLKLLHYLAIVVTTSNKLVAEPRQACMSPCICCSAALMLSCLGTAIDLLDIYRLMACMNWVT